MEGQGLSPLNQYAVQYRAKRDADTQIAPVVNSSNAPTLSPSTKVNAKDVPDATTVAPQLLGTNGTGQRKDYSIPVAASKPLLSAQPTLLGDANPNGNASANPTLTVHDDNDGFIDSIDEPEEAFNKTRDENAKGLKQQEDYWLYYNSSNVVDTARAKELWDSFQNHTVSSLLSKSHRRAIVSV